MRAGTTAVSFTRGDITQQRVGAIVNAANATLLGGGGVDGAIHEVGGPEILEACRRLEEDEFGRRCSPGSAAATTAGKLRAEIVVHTVGPIWRGGDYGEAEKLAGCYRSSLDVARSRGIRSIAFPSISTGAYGYPVADAAAVAVGAVRAWLGENPGTMDEVRFVLFSAEDHAAYEAAARAGGTAG